MSNRQIPVISAFLISFFIQTFAFAAYSDTNSAATKKDRSLGGTAKESIRETLGWKPKESDPKGFVKALNQASKTNKKDGRSEFEWRPADDRPRRS